MTFPQPRSERVLDGGRDEIAVIDIVETSGAAELGPGRVQGPSGAQVRFHPERQAVAALDEVSAGTWRGSGHIMLPAEARQDVPRTHESGIFEAAGDAIPPRCGISEAVLRLDQV